MRDLAESNHINFISKSKYYYTVNTKSEINSNDYINFIKNYFTDQNYSLFFKNPWTYINISNHSHMVNDWKIHISATAENHIKILNIVAKYAIAYKINFKFCSNIDQFTYINGKNVARASFGKFIVLYPLEEQFLSTLEDLYKLLEDFEGPYILSDRPYKDSKTIYYRYGEINPIRLLDGYGTITTKIIDNNNNLISDERVPYFKIPDFVEDNLYKPIDKSNSKLLEEYKIEKSLHFSAQGGVYVGTRNGQTYVIKEARKFAGLDSNLQYSTERLKKEYNIMNYLKDLDVVPNVIEFIEDCGNCYLVEDFIEGETLTKFPYNNSPLIKVEKNEVKIKTKFNNDLMNIVNLSLQAIFKIHNNGIIIHDISPNNIIYNRENCSVKFIDYEVAYHVCDEYNKTPLFTHGFTSNGSHSSIQHDLHKLGLVFMHCIMPINKIFTLSSEKKIEALNLYESYDVIPQNVLETIKGLVCYNFSNADEAIKCLTSKHITNLKKKKIHSIKTATENIKLIKNSIISNINSSTVDYKVASDPTAFFTSEYSFGYGILGVLYSLNKLNIGENISSDKIKKIVKNFMTTFYREPNSLSSGLFVGLSGISVVLSELGFINESKIVMNRALAEKMTMYDLAYGLSGRIVALLKLYKATKDYRYVELAKKDAEEIKESAIIKNGLYYWKDECGDIYTGLTRGSSGIALALLYLYLETEDKNYLDIGIKALEADLSKLTKNDQGHTCFNGWPEPESEKSTIYSPYIHNGSAGLGCVTLRYFLITQNEKYKLITEELIESCNANMSLFPGYLRGMSGIMTFLQDCVVYLNSNTANEILSKMSSNIDFFRVSIDGINGYAGDELYRISNDLFTGSSGIILSLNRNTHLYDKPTNPFLPLDEYYDFINVKNANPIKTCI